MTELTVGTEPKPIWSIGRRLKDTMSIVLSSSGNITDVGVYLWKRVDEQWIRWEMRPDYNIFFLKDKPLDEDIYGIDHTRGFYFEVEIDGEKWYIYNSNRSSDSKMVAQSDPYEFGGSEIISPLVIDTIDVSTNECYFLAPKPSDAEWIRLSNDGINYSMWKETDGDIVSVPWVLDPFLGSRIIYWQYKSSEGKIIEDENWRINYIIPGLTVDLVETGNQ